MAKTRSSTVAGHAVRRPRDDRATTLPKRQVLLEVLLVQRGPSPPASSAAAGSAIASVSSCCEVPGEALPRRGQPHREGRPGVVVGVLGEPGEALGARREQRVDLGVLGLHRLQRRAVLRRCRARAASGQRPASSPVWWWCSTSAKTLPALRQQPPGGPVVDRGVPARPRRTSRGRAGRRGASRTSSACRPGPPVLRPARQAELGGPAGGGWWCVIVGFSFVGEGGAVTRRRACGCGTGVSG